MQCLQTLLSRWGVAVTVSTPIARLPLCGVARAARRAAMTLGTSAIPLQTSMPPSPCLPSLLSKCRRCLLPLLECRCLLLLLSECRCLPPFRNADASSSSSRRSSCWNASTSSSSAGHVGGRSSLPHRCFLALGPKPLRGHRRVRDSRLQVWGSDFQGMEHFKSTLILAPVVRFFFRRPRMR
jgi:hypothetical protein